MTIRVFYTNGRETKVDYYNSAMVVFGDESVSVYAKDQLGEDETVTYPYSNLLKIVQKTSN